MTKDLPWREAKIVSNENAARGSMWMVLEAADGGEASYEPGHVLSLSIKTDDGEYDHHAYTISMADPARNRFEILYRVIPTGGLTPRLAKLKPGDPIYFRGRAHTPIQKEVKDDAERIVGVATGTGMGPLYGYAAKTLNEGEKRNINLYIGMHEEKDMCCVAELELLGKKYPNFNFDFVLTEYGPDWKGLAGRVTEAVPPLCSDFAKIHFHLVGNGGMIDAMKKGLRKVGAERKHVTLEYYFNYEAKASQDEIDRIAGMFAGTAR